MKTLIEKILGANWRTNLFGWLTLLLSAIAVKPDLVNFLPESVRSYITGVAGLFAFISAGGFVMNSKDKQVTGNGSATDPFAVKDSPDSSSRVLTPLIAGLLSASLLLSGCASVGSKVSAWWNAPATQNNVHLAEQVAFNFAVNVGLSALQSYANGGKVDLQSAALAGGINTLYSQASSLRQLQGTDLVLDPVATAQVLQNGGGSKVISEAMAAQIIDNARALVNKGVPADRASEINAAGLDAAAAGVQEVPDSPLADGVAK